MDWEIRTVDTPVALEAAYVFCERFFPDLDAENYARRKWIERMRDRADPPNKDATFQCLFVDAAMDVYPNIAECAPWWRLGNLRTDGVEHVLRAYQNEEAHGMRANRTLPICTLAGRYGIPRSARLYDGGDLVRRFLRQWGAERESSF